MNQALIKYITISFSVLAGSVGLLWAHQSKNDGAQTQKIKSQSFRSTLDSIARSLDHVSEQKPRSLDVVIERLLAFINLYLKEHSSQQKHFSSYQVKLSSLLSSQKPYSEKIKLVRGLISDMKKPIT